MKNTIELTFPSYSCNEKLARSTVGAFILDLDPTAEQMTEIKTAVSEAVTNAIIHGYASSFGTVSLKCELLDRSVFISVSDCGRGISNIKRAMEPLFTDSTEGERSGMGFTLMEAFMDEVEVKSILGQGTEVRMKKELA